MIELGWFMKTGLNEVSWVSIKVKKMKAKQICYK